MSDANNPTRLMEKQIADLISRVERLEDLLVAKVNLETVGVALRDQLMQANHLMRQLIALRGGNEAVFGRIGRKTDA